MMTLRIVHQLATGALLACAMATSAWSQAFEEGKTMGRGKAQEGVNEVRGGSKAGLTPGYNPALPQKALYGNGSDIEKLKGMGNAQRQACDNPGDDPQCSGIKLGTTQQPKMNVSRSDPALTGSTVVANPTLVFGDIADTYSACTTSNLKQLSPATFADQSCTMQTNEWTTHMCKKTLTVVPHTRTTCEQGTWFGLSSGSAGFISQVTLEARCNIGARDLMQRYRMLIKAFGDHELDFKLPMFDRVPPMGAHPPLVTQLVLVAGDSPEVWIDVYAAGTSCNKDTCQMDFYLFGGQKGKPAGRVRSKPSCANGWTLGEKMMFPPAVCDSWPCPWVQGSEGACYSPAEPMDKPEDKVLAYLVGQSPGSASQWVLRGPSVLGPDFEVIAGHPENPTLHLKNVFARPGAPFITGESWTQDCKPFEDKTPGLLPDGHAKPTNPVLLPVIPIGDQACVKTYSKCNVGPATRLIDGVEVTRDCWEYQNIFQCATAATNSNCSLLANATCSNKEQPVCETQDFAGRCMKQTETYSCKASDAVLSPGVNCGSSFCTGGSCWEETPADPNDSFAMAVAQLQARTEAGIDFDTDKMRIFSGTPGYCGKHSFGLKSCCNSTDDLTACADEEKALVQKRNAGLCAAVADKCVSNTLFGCKTRHYKFCCFSSMLARIVHEQARNQVSKGWGDFDEPDCSGFSVNEFVGLDWSLIDLSEWFSKINAVPPDLAQIKQQNEDQAPQCYYGRGRCGS